MTNYSKDELVKYNQEMSEKKASTLEWQSIIVIDN